MSQDVGDGFANSRSEAVRFNNGWGLGNSLNGFSTSLRRWRRPSYHQLKNSLSSLFIVTHHNSML